MTNNITKLRHADSFRFPIIEPFNFLFTFWKPSHFATGLEAHTETVFWRSFRFDKAMCGVRFERINNEVAAEVFANKYYDKEIADKLYKRIENGYGLNEDITPFLCKMHKIKEMRPVLKDLAGMRYSCGGSLFEISMILLVLQNTGIKRTISMFSFLLERFGNKITFDRQVLNIFYSPQDLLSATENMLREEGRFGYRAKFVPEFAGFFSQVNDEQLRGLPQNQIIERLKEIKGVGNYTATGIAGAMRDSSALTLDVWNCKIFAKHLGLPFDVPKEEMREYMRKKFGKYAGLAGLYLTEYAFVNS